MDILFMRYGKHCVPGWTWSVRVGEHHGFTLWSVWGGSGQLSLGEKTYPLRFGDIFLIQYETPVRAFQTEGDPLNIQYIDFAPAYPEDLRGWPEHCFISDRHFTAGLFKRFQRAEENGEVCQMSAWLNALLYTFKNEPESVREGGYVQKIDSICKMFRQSPDVQYSIHELAAGLSVSTDHFIRVFRQEKGVTPYIYLQRLRLETAQGLLRMSDLSITDVAGACGFSSIYHFSRFFREKTGCTPSEYRRNPPGLTGKQ